MASRKRYIVATKAIFRKSVQTVVDMIHAQFTKTEKMAFLKISCADE